VENISKKVHISVGNFSELTEQEQKLFEYAAQVRMNAQAPYSNYFVGVAVLSDQDTIHVGCNVERCSLTQTTHAEQNAIDSMVAALGPSKIKSLAVVAAPAHVEVDLRAQKKSPRPALESMAWCCGHCLQIIWENCFGDTTVKILSLLPNGEVAAATIGDVLPIHFGPENVGIVYQNYRRDGKERIGEL
jgi:cytidine deaminase